MGNGYKKQIPKYAAFLEVSEDILKNNRFITMGVEGDHMPVVELLVEKRLLSAEVVDTLLRGTIARHDDFGSDIEVESEIWNGQQVTNNS